MYLYIEICYQSYIICILYVLYVFLYCSQISQVIQCWWFEDPRERGCLELGALCRRLC